jgi:hypothetical protein
LKLKLIEERGKQHILIEYSKWLDGFILTLYYSYNSGRIFAD